MTTSPSRLANRLASHYETLEKQKSAGRFAMWIFLGTEVLLFAGLFVCYAVYRFLYPAQFQLASSHLDVALGTVETADLLTSSLFAVLAVHFVRRRNRKLTMLFLALTIACGLGFLVMHGLEYLHEFQEGIFPGPAYHFEELPYRGAGLFYTLYFVMTGLHGIHVTAGIGVLGTMLALTALGRFDDGYDLPIELSALYWHLVDLIWIFLYPLLYLIG